MFYGAYADCGKGMQCVVAIFHILYGDELVEKLRQDFLDNCFLFLFFRSHSRLCCYIFFGQSIIAVDMFLNLVTTNSSEALELLDNLIPAIVIVVLLYIPALAVATVSVIKNGNCRSCLSTESVSAPD